MQKQENNFRYGKLPSLSSFVREEGEGEGEGEGNSSVFVEREDPVTKKKIKIPKELDVFYGHVISATRKSAEEKYKPILEAVEQDKSELTEVRAELEKIREESMTAEERAQKNAEKKIREHEVLVKRSVEEAEKYKALFTQSTIRNDIYSSFGEAKLCNPDQTRMVFEQEGQARLEEIVDNDGKPTGRFETRVTIDLVNDKGEAETVEGTPKQLFQKWINQDRNLHHQVNNLSRGGGSQGNSGSARVDWSALSPSDRLNQARRTS